MQPITGPSSAGVGAARVLLQEAINCYRTTLRLKPDHPHAYNNLGNAMKDKVRRPAVVSGGLVAGIRRIASSSLLPSLGRSVVETAGNRVNSVRQPSLDPCC